MTTAKPEKPTSKDYAMGYAEGFNDGCAPTEPDDLTIAYMSGFADGKKVAQPVQPAPVIVAPDADAHAMNGLHGESYGVDWVYPPKPQSAQPAEPDNLTIAYMSGFADGKKSVQPAAPAINSIGTTK